MKLKTKLTLIVACVTLCTLAASFVLLGLLVRRDDLQDLDHALAKQAAKAVARGVGRESAGAIEDAWVEIPDMLDVVRRHAALYDDDGRLLHATRSFEGMAPRFQDLGVQLPLPPEGVPVDSGLHSELLRGIVVQIPGTDKVLLYAVSRREIDDDTAFLYRTLALLLLAATAIVVVVARYIGERLAREVGQIALVARNVAGGELSARIGTTFSSVELNSLARDVDHMVAQLDRLVAAQQTFVSHAAHELRSPLTTLRGELQLALRRPRDADGYRRSLEQVLSDVEALIALSEDLLTLARVQAEPQRPQHASVAEMLSNALSLTQARAQQAGVQIHAPAPPTADLHVRGKPSELARALRNLLDNAIAHSASDDSVELAWWQQEQQLHISVSDRGSGVSAADASRVFEPFFRGTQDQWSEHGGAGLGLAIAREIVQRSSGSLMHDTSYTKGARFLMVLPITSSQAPD
jgi:two-component system OmpR family sensor kinase